MKQELLEWMLCECDVQSISDALDRTIHLLSYFTRNKTLQDMIKDK